MKQRVGIARAFAIQPKMLLLDEPFGALDALTRGVIQDELLNIVRETHQTVFMITHDVDEAILLADRILLMSNGPRRARSPRSWSTPAARAAPATTCTTTRTTTASATTWSTSWCRSPRSCQHGRLPGPPAGRPPRLEGDVAEAARRTTLTAPNVAISSTKEKP
jgi:nitrate/nitrite transport system ATP-binding protein